MNALEERYHTRVEIGGFQAKLFPIPTAVAENVVFREGGRTGVPPMITIRKLSIEAGFVGLLSKTRKISRVRLEGLVIHVPPKREEESSGGPSKASEIANARFEVQEIIADGTLLEILPKDPGKPPKQFQIQRLTLHSVGPRQAMRFDSVLTNFKPPGEIVSNGRFGPWQQDDPAATPVLGVYTFEHADLSVFKGISGTLSSKGKYSGILGRIEVDGTADTPNFQLTSSGHPVDLKNTFHSIVDGTNGDTLLQPVTGDFLHSQVLARGGVTGTPGVQGKTVSLDLNISHARVEDMLRLAMQSNPPPITGSVQLQAKLVIPPGDREVLAKMYLNGKFNIGSARFANLDVQQKLGELSRRAKGDLQVPASDRVVSNLNGSFVLKNGVATFSQLSFRVPGAVIQLHGTYAMRGEQLDFEGTARLQAKLSQMTTGIKSDLLKVVDPFFRKNGATQFPIKITGTRSQPKFDLVLKFHL